MAVPAPWAMVVFCSACSALSPWRGRERGVTRIEFTSKQPFGHIRAATM